MLPPSERGRQLSLHFVWGSHRVWAVPPLQTGPAPLPIRLCLPQSQHSGVGDPWGCCVWRAPDNQCWASGRREAARGLAKWSREHGLEKSSGSERVPALPGRADIVSSRGSGPGAGWVSQPWAAAGWLPDSAQP